MRLVKLHQSCTIEYERLKQGGHLGATFQVHVHACMNQHENVGQLDSSF